MTCSRLDAMEAKLQDAFCELVYLQTSTAKTNNDVKKAVNERTVKDLDRYVDSVGVFGGLSDVSRVFSIIATVVGVIMDAVLGFATLGGWTAISIILGSITAVIGMADGGIQMATGITKANMAECDGAVNKDYAMGKYLSDKADDIVVKTKDAYQVLSSLMRTFNEMIAVLADAKNKTIKRRK